LSRVSVRLLPNTEYGQHRQYCTVMLFVNDLFERIVAIYVGQRPLYLGASAMPNLGFNNPQSPARRRINFHKYAYKTLYEL